MAEFAETFYNDFTLEYPEYDTMGIGADQLQALYPDKDNREMLLRAVRSMFRGQRVSYEEAGDLLRLGEGGPEGNANPDGSLRVGNIYAGLEHVATTPVEVRQATRAKLFEAAVTGV